jgi:probable phosphoglycerate mutase
VRLIAVRHGETEWNVQRREMGQLDSALTALGRQQAERLAQRLRGARLDALYTSDLGRAVDTANAIGAACGLEAVRDASLRERDLGIFEGMTRAEMAERHPHEFADYLAIGHEYPIPRGESGVQRTERSVRALTAIAERHPGKTVAAVTHGGFLMGFLEHVLAMPPGSGPRFKRQNASYNSFEYADGRWALETWNDVSHLEGLEARDDPGIVERG